MTPTTNQYWEQTIYCNGWFEKLFGLMFRKRTNAVMEFPQEQNLFIHTLFMFFPIDVFLLDENMKVVEEKRSMAPFRFWFPSKKAKYVVEIAQ